MKNLFLVAIVALLAIVTPSLAGDYDDYVDDHIDSPASNESDFIFSLTNDNLNKVLDELLYKEDAKPLFMTLLTRKCEECWEAQNDFSKLAALVHRQNNIARVDCQYEPNVCRMFNYN
jgi:thioredoxin-like negative regulator of GroEL